MRRLALLVPLVILVCSSPLLADCSALSFVTILDGNLSAQVFTMGAARDYFFEGPLICQSPGCWATSQQHAGYDALGNLYTYGQAGALPVSLWRTSPQGLRSELVRIVPQDLGIGCSLLATPGVAINAVDGWVDIAFQGGFSEGNPVLIRVSGLPRLLDVFASYTPSIQVAVSPAKFPDGLLQPLEAQDLVFGDVGTLPDFSRATRSCGAVRLPAGADPVLIADPLGEPAVGHSLFFLVASRGLTETRMGRALVGGTFNGRDVSKLPVCQ